METPTPSNVQTETGSAQSGKVLSAQSGPLTLLSQTAAQLGTYRASWQTGEFYALLAIIAALFVLGDLGKIPPAYAGTVASAVGLGLGLLRYAAKGDYQQGLLKLVEMLSALPALPPIEITHTFAPSFAPASDSTTIPNTPAAVGAGGGSSVVLTSAQCDWETGRPLSDSITTQRMDGAEATVPQAAAPVTAQTVATAPPGGGSGVGPKPAILFLVSGFWLLASSAPACADEPRGRKAAPLRFAAHAAHVRLRPVDLGGGELEPPPWLHLLYTPDDRPVYPLIVTHTPER